MGHLKIAKDCLINALYIRTQIYGANSTEVVSIQRLLKENERMQQVKNNDEHQAIDLPNADDRQTESKLPSLTVSATKKQVVQCFTSDGVKMLEYDASKMEKLSEFNRKKGLLTIEADCGIQNYGTKNYRGDNLISSAVINKLLSFAHIRKDLSGNVPDKYISIEF